MRSMLRSKGEKKYTWQDYLAWPDEERWEVIDGVAYGMTPSPSSRHQVVAGNFFALVRERLRGKSCRVFVAPLDVYLDDFNFVQPDVMVVCDEKKIRDRIYGAPDLVVEVLSPATSLKDKREKKDLYEKFGVREYVIVHPEEMLVERFFLSEGGFKGPDVFGSQEVLPLLFLDGVEVLLWDVFEVEPPGEGEGA
ncbi:MAG: Uma2 family endonuclease [Nitrospirae bacterium]|nr:Uma2 family endonuclease [Nitrospirota bacterium]MBI3393147.1 Uma2 family endonuclease [Nitrospirota bacterium]